MQFLVKSVLRTLFHAAVHMTRLMVCECCLGASGAGSGHSSSCSGAWQQRLVWPVFCQLSAAEMIAGETECLSCGSESSAHQAESITASNPFRPGSFSRVQQDNRDAIHIRGEVVSCSYIIFR